MPELNNAMDIFKLLDKSNCKKCNKPTCLAFAAAVFQGRTQLDECPKLPREIIERYSGKVTGQVSMDEEMARLVEGLKKKLAETDLAEAARRLDADFSNGRLTIKILGKNFSIDTSGAITTDIHVNPWVMLPVFSYITEGKGVPASGKWVPFRELEGGKSWYRLFGQRCEKPLKRVADTYTDLFEDMIHLFNGKKVQNHYESDISLVLHPLPKVPVLICYWKPADGLESDLHIFFDAAAEKNLHIESIYRLGAGLVVMFEKLALRHGYELPAAQPA